MEELLCDIAAVLTVLGAPGETMFGEKVVLREIPRAAAWVKEMEGLTNVVEERATTSDGLVLVKRMEDVVTERLCGVAHDERAEVGSLTEGDRMGSGRKVEREADRIVGGLGREGRARGEPVDERHPRR
jgi:hypothetical protein